MKKIYFLISLTIAFLVPSLINGINTNNISPVVNDQGINVTKGKYLNLAYQAGNFYSWNQTDNADQHVIGLYIKDGQSYLLDSFGVFWTLNYQINHFYRISDTNAIATIAYFKDDNNEYFNQNFILTLNSNNITINQTPISSNNINFARLDDTHAVAYGIGLELIDISANSVTELIPPYDKGEFPTFFYTIDSNDGIFVAGDQYYYLLNNITESLTQTQIALMAPNTSDSNVVVFDSNDVIIRSSGNNLNFVDISNASSIVINSWQDQEGKSITSNANNIAFVLNSDTFILNISFFNSSSRYGAPYLVKKTDWSTLIAIPNIATIDNFMIINNNSGIFINKDLQANNFTYQSSDDSFTLSLLGTLNNFQFINNSLFFGSVTENNLLLTLETNQTWALISNIEFSPKSTTTNTNFLNTMITTSSNTINYQNTYFGNSSVHLNITDSFLQRVLIEPLNGTISRLFPENNNVQFDFLNFDVYTVTFTFFSNTGEQSVKYVVNIANFNSQDLISVTGTNVISYVGIAKEKLYDIRVIDQSATFMISNYNYNYLEYVELYIYQDATDVVVKNKYNLEENSEIQFSTEQFFFGLKMFDLLGQANWLYLGFSQDGVNPMEDFWASKQGKNLMNQALGHRYLERDLRKMNSQEIMQLISTSRTWTAIATQGKSIIIAGATIFAIALAFIVSSIGFNIYLNHTIEIRQVEKNKILKNPLD